MTQIQTSGKLNNTDALKYCCELFKEHMIASIDKSGKKFFKRNITFDEIEKEFSPEDYNKFEIYHSIHFKNGDLLFVYDIDFHEYEYWKDSPEDILNTIMTIIKHIDRNIIELKWKYSGRGVQGTAVITKENVDFMDEYYGSVYVFMRQLSNYIDFKLRKDKDVDIIGDTSFMHRRGLIRSIGSIHLKVNRYCIPIRTNNSANKIITTSNVGTCYLPFFKILNLKNILKYIKKPKHSMIQQITKNIDYCQFLEYAIENKLPEGGRHMCISKNLAIYLSNKPDKKQKYYNIQFNGGRSKELENWLNWLKMKNNTPFISCGELIMFQMKYLKKTYCKNCKYYKLDDGDKK